MIVFIWLQINVKSQYASGTFNYWPRWLFQVDLVCMKVRVVLQMPFAPLAALKSWDFWYTSAQTHEPVQKPQPWPVLMTSWRRLAALAAFRSESSSWCAWCPCLGLGSTWASSSRVSPRITGAGIRRWRSGGRHAAGAWNTRAAWRFQWTTAPGRCRPAPARSSTWTGTTRSWPVTRRAWTWTEPPPGAARRAGSTITRAGSRLLLRWDVFTYVDTHDKTNTWMKGKHERMCNTDGNISISVR